MKKGAADTSGVLFIAFGDRWCEEARRSIASIRRCSDLPVAVVTDQAWNEAPQPEHFIIRPALSGWAAKPSYMMEAAPYEKTLFLDTDTFVLRDPSPVFGLLDHYDIGVRFGGPQLNLEPGLVFHTQCNSGVVLFRKSQAVEQVKSIWQAEYERARGNAKISADTRGLGDQRYLAVAIALSNARPVHLGEYLNFALFETILTYSPPVIIHTRLKNGEAIGKDICKDWDPARDWHPRLWLPNIRGILPAGVRRSDPALALALLLRRAWNQVRRSFMNITF